MALKESLRGLLRCAFTPYAGRSPFPSKIRTATPGKPAKQMAKTATPKQNGTDERSTKEREKQEGGDGKSRTGDPKGQNESARDVYVGGNGASSVTNVGRTVASGRPRGWSYATALGGTPKETR